MALALLLLLAACGGGAAVTKLQTAPAGLTPTPSPPVTALPTPPATPSPTPTPTPTPAPALTGFRMPIEGACLPTSPNLLPNAPRPYRAGVHEGIDFYDGFSCVRIGRGTPVLAAKAGVVVRADHDYRPLTPQELDELLRRSRSQGYTDEQALDRFRGRQVWIDHGGGVVTRYAHLDGVAPDIQMGTRVEAGQVIGYVGNSGTPEEVTAPGTEFHLHFEIRVGDSYLGKGLPYDELMDVLRNAFSS
ncbi:MAG: M23 family metallopeptidase [Dehalococcoidia bacterium]|nr:M23 family metallopeptidase [Dehalococcoidia bacterium]MDW8008668.1 M23 family metallopeptidase [Chloroflexota bacterium]